MLVFGFVEYTKPEFHSSLSESKVNADIDFFEVMCWPFYSRGLDSGLDLAEKKFLKSLLIHTTQSNLTN